MEPESGGGALVVMEPESGLDVKPLSPHHLLIKGPRSTSMRCSTTSVPVLLLISKSDPRLCEPSMAPSPMQNRVVFHALSPLAGTSTAVRTAPPRALYSTCQDPDARSYHRILNRRILDWVLKKSSAK